MTTQSKRPKIQIIVGPTASGKTGLGITLARRSHVVRERRGEGGAVLSADSRQIYAGLNIGTAKPPEVFAEPASVHPVNQPDMLEDVPHYFFNIREITQPYELATWQQDAFAIIDQLIAANKTPILVGGTMLYLDSVAFNFSIPAVAPNAEFRQEMETKDVETLYAQLLSQDPRSANFVQPGNKRRIIRALEVMAFSGQLFSSQRLQHEPKYDVEWIGLFPGFDVLATRIASRIDQMIVDGLLDETKQLQEKYGVDAPLLKTINYAQAADVLAGRLPEAELATKMTQANVRYAHRQMSWWKRNPAITWYNSADDFLAQ